jgi:hypothetical protein
MFGPKLIPLSLIHCTIHGGFDTVKTRDRDRDQGLIFNSLDLEKFGF